MQGDDGSMYLATMLKQIANLIKCQYKWDLLPSANSTEMTLVSRVALSVVFSVSPITSF